MSCRIRMDQATGLKRQSKWGNDRRNMIPECRPSLAVFAKTVLEVKLTGFEFMAEQERARTIPILPCALRRLVFNSHPTVGGGTLWANRQAARAGRNKT